MSTNTTANRPPRQGFVFTGWHMLATMLLFFGVIIGVNFTMAWFAHSSWSGLVVENSYVASQEFNEKAALAKSIEASGITGALTVEKDMIAYQLSDGQAKPVVADRVTLNFRRPVGDHQDFALALNDNGGGRFTASHPVLPGQWIVEAEASSGDRIVMHEAVRILVDGEKK